LKIKGAGADDENCTIGGEFSLVLFSPGCDWIYLRSEALQELLPPVLLVVAFGLCGVPKLAGLPFLLFVFERLDFAEQDRCLLELPVVLIQYILHFHRPNQQVREVRFSSTVPPSGKLNQNSG
jgi:hypothetical protein